MSSNQNKCDSFPCYDWEEYAWGNKRWAEYVCDFCPGWKEKYEEDELPKCDKLVTD